MLYRRRPGMMATARPSSLNRRGALGFYTLRHTLSCQAKERRGLLSLLRFMSAECDKRARIHKSRCANCLKNKALENDKMQKKEMLFFTKRSGEVIENKGQDLEKHEKRTGKWPLFFTKRSFELIENTGSRPLLRKTNRSGGAYLRFKLIVFRVRSAEKRHSTAGAMNKSVGTIVPGYLNSDSYFSPTRATI
ncbi:MAG: hypothetical protein ACRD2O_02655 [Terriglobia bacterium]